MRSKLQVRSEVSKTVSIELPLYLFYSSLGDDENIVFGEDYAEFWKIESNWKITIIRENSNSIEVITYRDENNDSFYEHVSDEMLKEKDGWSIVDENIYDAAFNRLIDKVTNA